MRKTVSVVVMIGVSVAFGAVLASAQGGSSEDEQAIRKLHQSFAEAWTNHDAQAMAIFWAEDGDFIGPDRTTNSYYTIAAGSDADLVLVDINREFEVDYRKLFSAADWSLYQGKKLKGQPVMTIKGGEIVMREGNIIPDHGTGKRLKRNL